jgi:hypothetical protein
MQIRRAPSAGLIPSAKSEYPKLLAELERIDQELLGAIREQWPEHPHAQIHALRELLGASEQYLRIQGVHRYFEGTVRPLMVGPVGEVVQASSNKELVAV